MTGILGLDIGGANTKTCYLEIVGKKVLEADGNSVYQPLWENPDGLYHVLRNSSDYLLRNGKHLDGIALTMTAELCDGFVSKTQGVISILRSVEAVFPDIPIFIWTLKGDFLSPDEIRKQPLQAAAANWLASAYALAESIKSEDSIIFADMGSTTTDIVPITKGRVMSKGQTDTERLISGELLYSGVLRTPIHSLISEIYLDGFTCQVAKELFAVSADVYRFLEQITEEVYDVSTPDCRGRSLEDCIRRLARIVCSEPEELGMKNIYLLARTIMEKQIRQIQDNILRVISQKDVRLPQELIITGQGIFLLEEAARRLGWKATPWWDIIPGGKPQIALTCYAAAWLLFKKLLEGK